MADQSLRCDGSNLVRCNSDGTSEATEACSLGCNASALRCNDIDPSNGLAQFLDMAATEPDVNLGMTATINTNDGTVVVDGNPVTVRNALIAQTNGPPILVFIVHSLIANDVTVNGNGLGGNAFALVSNSDVRIGGIFNASARSQLDGPGVYNDANCQGGRGIAGSSSSVSGAGGGGFGTAGGAGGSASTSLDSATGGSGGKPTGTPALIPLRGGCDSGPLDVLHPRAVGSGGGAIQLVSHTKISIIGVVAANGSSFAGGGSGGGILIEAPIIEVTGSVLANGAGGIGGCFAQGENGRLDATPALGGTCSSSETGNGGKGSAGAIAATGGDSIHLSNADAALAGHGGGGVGRIRINSASGGFHRAGLFSPDPSTGAIAIR